jgi:alanyl aminopeptidase
MVAPVLWTAAHEGDAALFDAFVAEALKADRTDREHLLFALAAFREPALAQRALGLMLDERFDPREIDELPRVSAHWPTTRTVAWDYVKTHFDALTKRLSAETMSAYTALPAAFCDEAHRAEGQAFFAPRVASLPGGPRELEQSLEKASLCVKLVAVQGPSVASFLKSY